MKQPCPECGLLRQNIKTHIGSGPCRGEQIVQGLQKRGLYPLPRLAFAKLLKWADLPYERIPALAQHKYRRSGAWDAQKRKRLVAEQDYSGALYKDLGDRLFVEQWVVLVLKLLKPSLSAQKKMHAPLIEMLREMEARGEEFKKALVVAYMLGGPTAVNDILKGEGLWN